jgi:hypothetical protein
MQFIDTMASFILSGIQFEEKGGGREREPNEKNTVPPGLHLRSGDNWTSDIKCTSCLCIACANTKINAVHLVESLLFTMHVL